MTQDGMMPHDLSPCKYRSVLFRTKDGNLSIDNN